MTHWKPKIWRVNGLWLCSYYRNSPSTAAAGRTPTKAYNSWKWKEHQKYLPLGAAAKCLGTALEGPARCMRRLGLMGPWYSILIQIGQGLSATRFVDCLSRYSLGAWGVKKQAVANDVRPSPMREAKLHAQRSAQGSMRGADGDTDAARQSVRFLRPGEKCSRRICLSSACGGRVSGVSEINGSGAMTTRKYAAIAERLDRLADQKEIEQDVQAKGLTAPRVTPQ